MIIMMMWMTMVMMMMMMLQDYNYIWHGCMEVTLELSCCKFPPASELQQFWEDNRKSLLTFLGEAHRGVKGFVKDETFTPIEGASMKVRGRDVGFQTTKEGEFWRILLPGIYTMEVFAEGYAPREVQFAIVEQNPTMLNITLYKVIIIIIIIIITSSYHCVMFRTCPGVTATRWRSQSPSPRDCFLSTPSQGSPIYYQSYQLLAESLLCFNCCVLKKYISTDF